MVAVAIAPAAPDDLALPDVVKAITDEIHARSSPIGVPCHFLVFATESGPGVAGGRDQFISTMREELDLDSRELESNLRAWDASSRPIAVVHWQDTNPPDLFEQSRNRALLN